MFGILITKMELTKNTKGIYQSIKHILVGNQYKLNNISRFNTHFYAFMGVLCKRSMYQL